MKTEAQINQEYKDSFAEAVESVGGNPFALPIEVRERLQETHRQEWVTWISERDMTARQENSTWATQANALRDIVLKVPGLRVNADVLAGMGKVPKRNATRFIAENPSLFVADGVTGWYVVTIPVADVPGSSEHLPQAASSGVDAARAASLLAHPSAAPSIRPVGKD